MTLVTHTPVLTCDIMVKLLVCWTLVLWVLAPRAPLPRLQRVASAIVSATLDPYEQSMLAAISFHETTLGRRGVPFGVVAYARAHGTVTLEEGACAALAILRRAERACGRVPERQLGHFHTGNGCRVDPFSRLESRTISRIRRLKIELSAME